MPTHIINGVEYDIRDDTPYWETFDGLKDASNRMQELAQMFLFEQHPYRSELIEGDSDLEFQKDEFEHMLDYLAQELIAFMCEIYSPDRVKQAISDLCDQLKEPESEPQSTERYLDI